MTNPDSALARLLAGNRRFVEGKLENPRRDPFRRTEVAQRQRPFAIVLTCSDSRVAPEVVFDQGLGDLFVARVAGNTGNDPLVIGTMEYAALNLDSELLMVLGHQGCGAVKGAVDVVTKGVTLPGGLAAVTRPIVPAVHAVRDQPAGQLLDAAVQQNITLTAQALAAVPTFADLVQRGKLDIVGYMYQLHTGRVVPVPAALPAKH